MKKRFKLLVPALILLIQTTYLRADVPKTYQNIMTTLANSILTHDFKTMRDILSYDAKMKLSRNNKVIVHTKDQLIELMRSQQQVVLNCTSNIEYLSVSDAIVIARLDMKFKDFTAFNYVTLEKNEEEEWKVSSIYKLYNIENKDNQDLAKNSK